MLLLALLVGIPTLSAQQSKKEKKEQKKEAVMKLIESENYKIDVNTAMPMRGRSIPLTSSYSLTIRNDSVISYLPYYGRAYSIPYGGGDGLNFKTILKEYNVEMDKKGDNLVYDSEKKVLQMLSNGKRVGDAIDMSEMVNDDETIHFGDENNDPTADTEAVIYFG